MSRSTAPKGQAKNKGPKYRSGEIDCLLELAQEKIPISGEDWDDIAREHYIRYPDKDRNGDSLKRKFYSLAKTKARTGDPTIPPAVAKAKKIYREIVQETDGSTGSPHQFEELEMPDDDECGTEKNSDGDSYEQFNFDCSNHVGKFVGTAVGHQIIGNGVDEMFGAAVAHRDAVIDNRRSVELAVPRAQDRVNGFGDGNVGNGFNRHLDRATVAEELVGAAVDCAQDGADGVGYGEFVRAASSISNSSNKIETQREKKIKQRIDSSPLSMQFHHKRSNKKHQVSEDFSMRDMCQMFLIQSSQEMAMRREELKNEMEMRRQEMAMHREMLASQQQMMNMMMMNFRQQSSKKPRKDSKRSNNSNSE